MAGFAVWFARLIFAIVAFLSATIVCAFAAIVLHPPERLAQLNPSGAFTADGIFPGDKPHTWIRGQRFGSWSGSDANVGVLRSDAFGVGIGVQGYVAGFPDHEGISVEIVRADGTRHLRLTGLPTSGQTWTFFRFYVPKDWVGASVRLIATDASRTFGGWVGIATISGIDGSFSAITRSAWWVLALASSLLTAILAAVPLCGLNRRWIGGPALFAVSIFVTLLVYRLPSIDSGWLFNPDEAQMTAQAITAVHHPIPWRDYDGTTSGPLNTLVVAIPAFAGLAPTLSSSRFIQVLLLAGALAFFASALRVWCDEAITRLAVLLPLVFLCTAADYAFIAYTSETLSLFLLAGAMALFARFAAREHGRPIALVVISGFTIGSLVFAKLQAAPYAAFLATATAATLWPQSTVRERATRLGAFALGLIAMPGLIIIVTAATGALADFWLTYVLFPRLYVAGNGDQLAPPIFFFQDQAFGEFLVLAIAFACTGIVVATAISILERRTLGRATVIAALLFIVMTGLGVLMIEAPRTPFLHYLLWLLFPVAGIVAMAYEMANEQLVASRFGALRSAAVVLSIALAIAPAVQLLRQRSTHETTVSLAPAEPIDLEARILQQFIAPGQTAAMWGWMPQYLVYADALMGTRDSITQFQIEARPLKAYFRNRYLQDFRRNKPDFMIEAIGPGTFAFGDRTLYGLQTFPDLYAAVRQGYDLVFDAESWRIYRRHRLVTPAAPKHLHE